MHDIPVDSVLEEVYLIEKYGENADLRLAKMYEDTERALKVGLIWQKN